MIKKTEAFKTEDGECHLTMEAAQEHAIFCVMKLQMANEVSLNIAKKIMEHKTAILTILTGQRGKDKQPRKRKATLEATP